MLATVGVMLLIGATSAPGIASPGKSSATGPRPLTEQELADMSPQEQATVLGPLRDLAHAVETVGRDTQTEIFTGVALQPTSHSVDVWVTDVVSGDGLLAAAKELDPGIDVRLAHLLPAEHSRVDLDRAATEIIDHSISKDLPYALYTLAVQPDGSGLELGVGDPAAARVKAAAMPGPSFKGRGGVDASIKLTFIKASQGVPFNRDDDTSPWVGGDGISNGAGLCTLGVPALRKSDNKPVILTAGHCYDNGSDIWTAGGKYYMGRVTARTPYCTAKGQAHCFDAETIAAPNISAAAEGIYPHPITSVKYSAMNDYVCHDGYMSYKNGKGDQVCGIKVTNANFWAVGSDIGWVQGVQGKSTGYAGTPGDSGGTVYTYDACGCNKLQARGSVTGGPVPNGKEIWWTETLDHFSYFGLKLNPKTTWP